MVRLMAILSLALLAAACGPITVEQAERQCFDRARLAVHPRGTVKLGTGSGGGLRGELSLEVSSDYLQGRDPSALYDACVYQKSGQPPRQPLYTRPDWQG